ncbi:membrane protein [Bacteroidia bacterium]|nr:membrane protein [Bacteroidia bacterium]
MQGSSQQVLTLEKALEIAFENSPVLIQSKLSLQQSELNLQAQKASLKSQFSLDVNPFTYSRSNRYDDYNSKWYDSKTMTSSASFGVVQPVKWTDGKISLVNDIQWQDAQNQTSGVTSTAFSHDVSLRIEQPIFTYNRTKMQLQELELRLENARLNYALQQLSIEKTVTTNFFGVYQRQKELSVAREELANQKLNYEIVKNKVEAGLVAKEELYQAEINLATSESSVYSQNISFENSKDNFKLLLGLSLDEDVLAMPNIDVASVNVEVNEAVKKGLEQRMELRQKQITLEQDVFSLVRAKAENEFKGSITARIGLNSLGEKVSNIYDNPTDNEQVGISLTIPIYDWGANKARVESTKLGSESDEISFDEQKKEITLSIRQICRNLPTLISQIEIKKKTADNAQRTYELNQEKYGNGNLTGMELQQYQSQLTSAKQAYTNAIIDYKIEVLNLKIQTLWDFQGNESYLKK